jgi:hypothetical protein
MRTLRVAQRLGIIALLGMSAGYWMIVSQAQVSPSSSQPLKNKKCQLMQREDNYYLPPPDLCVTDNRGGCKGRCPTRGKVSYFDCVPSDGNRCTPKQGTVLFDGYSQPCGRTTTSNCGCTGREEKFTGEAPGPSCS